MNNLKSIVLILLFQLSLNAQTKITPAEFVNPFIGTSNGGNTFPGAVVPWGMISLSPHNAPGAPSGYLFGEKYFYGIGSTHLSGTGCADLGGIIFTLTKGNVLLYPENYKTTYKNEKAEPGYYSVYLPDYKSTIETTVNERSGFIRITSKEDTELVLLIDVGRSFAIEGGGKISFNQDNTFGGYNISGGFCGEDNRQKVFFAAEINADVLSNGTWKGSKSGDIKSIESVDKNVGGWIKLKLIKNEPVLIKLAVSYTSEKNAQLNLDSEMSGWNFERVREQAYDKWNNELSRITVEGQSRDDKTKFYTALYHMLIHPNIISDVNGEYPLMGRSGIGKYNGRKRYSVFSLWDTYRTLHPFLTLVYPEVQSEIIKTMLDMYKESGFLPKWELAGLETYMMVGDAASIVIADSYIKGIRDYDENAALEAMLKPVMLNVGESAPPVRAGYHELLKYKYIPFDQDMSKEWWVWGPVSTTLEYNLCDHAISKFAKEMDRGDIADEFYTRSMYYKNLFDESTQFMRPRLASGEWLDPFDSLATEGSGYWEGSGGPGYVEGNAWNYTWFVPHDIAGLIRLFGGEKKFADKLLQSFNNDQFTINNEPDIAYPYLFTYIKGKEILTAKLVNEIIENEFGIDHNGLPGNDDCGTISAWLAFSMLGFYPACPAIDEYRINLPVFDKVRIELNNQYYEGQRLTISRRSDTSDNVRLNNKSVNNYSVKHSDLVKGGKLEFK